MGGQQSELLLTLLCMLLPTLLHSLQLQVRSIQAQECTATHAR